MAQFGLISMLREIIYIESQVNTVHERPIYRLVHKGQIYNVAHVGQWEYNPTPPLKLKVECKRPS